MKTLYLLSTTLKSLKNISISDASKAEIETQV